MRKCRKCGETKSLDLFQVDNSTKDGIMYWCKDCRNTQKREYRRRMKKNNPEAYNRYRAKENKRERNSRKSWKEWAAEQGYGYCIACGAPDPEFHHMIPEEKESTMSDLFKKTFNDENKEIVLIELKKTKPLCNPCHIEIHRRVMAIYGLPVLEEMIQEKAR